MEYDIIGDVHGQAAMLERLLTRLDYAPAGRGYRPPQGRQVLFVGDLIDRGEQQLRVLEIVRAMVDSGAARVVMGNHEFNAIGYATRGGEGEFLRVHSEKNLRQHGVFLAAVGEGSIIHRQWVEWFKTLPLFLDLGGVRVAHAWWDESAVRTVQLSLGASKRLSTEQLIECFEKGSPLYEARKRLTCGIEWDLPEGKTITDKEGHAHGEARLAVWRHWATSMNEIMLVPGNSADIANGLAIPEDVKLIRVDGSPLFIGHHWFSGPVELETPRLACLDWSAVRGGPLVAYRWCGETDLANAGFVYDA